LESCRTNGERLLFKRGEVQTWIERFVVGCESAKRRSLWREQSTAVQGEEEYFLLVLDGQASSLRASALSHPIQTSSFDRRSCGKGYQNT
jgi:hypothetical protein